ncbi:helix-turn-helix transcriptional regulator [Streptomyces sp. NPDC005483]|uniref:helix-turn-helix domain-containing protein n=1 Tax=Streptomyces sp. NPDC005483 TaxID=3154882 RepID=UPI0033B3F771
MARTVEPLDGQATVRTMPPVGDRPAPGWRGRRSRPEVRRACAGLTPASWCGSLDMGSERRERMKMLGARLRGLRADAGLTGAVSARRAYVGQPPVSKVDNGRMVPSADVLGRCLAPSASTR